MSQQSSTLKKCRTLLENNRIEDCLVLLKTIVTNEHESTITILKANLQRAKTEYNSMVLTREDYRVEIAKTISRISSIIDELKDETDKITIYFIGYNTEGMFTLNIQNEYQEINQAVATNPNTNLTLHNSVLNGLADLNIELADNKSIVIHFSCHGSVNGLYLGDENGAKKFENNGRIINFLRGFSNRIECILLSACDSLILGQLMANDFTNVVYMNQKVQDNSAIQYAKYFYLYLAKQNAAQPLNFETAHQYAHNTLDLHNKSDVYTVEFLKKITI